MASLDLAQAHMRLSKQQFEQSRSTQACKPQDFNCDRVATANLNGKFGVTGNFKFTSPAGSGKVYVKLSVTGLDRYVGPPDEAFTYHIHVHPITDGDCESALGHLNPFGVPPTNVCDPHNIKTCEVGDLSGKHGKLDAGKQDARYVDYQLKFSPENVSLVGRSVVIHDSTKKRIACGNIEFGSTEDFSFSWSARDRFRSH